MNRIRVPSFMVVSESAQIQYFLGTYLPIVQIKRFSKCCNTQWISQYHKVHTKILKELSYPKWIWFFTLYFRPSRDTSNNKEVKDTHWMCPKWHPTLNTVHYFWPGPIRFLWNVMHYVGNWVPLTHCHLSPWELCKCFSIVTKSLHHNES